MFHKIIAPFYNSFPTFDSRISLVLVIISIAVLINILEYLEWYEVFKHLVKRHASGVDFWKAIKTKKQEKYYLWVLNVFVVLACVMIGWISFTQRPYLLKATPSEGSILPSVASPITLEFDMPVDTTSLTYHISPEIDGQWRWESTHFGLVSRKLTFYPTTSYEPNSRVIIYLVGLKQKWFANASHEISFEFNAPKIPHITITDPADGAVQVPTDKAINLAFNSPLDSFVVMQYVVEPDAGEFTVTGANDFQSLTFAKPLAQDTTYTVKAFQGVTQFNIQTQEVVKEFPVEEIKSITFTTVTTPNLVSYSPKGNYALPNDPLVVVFNQAMDQGSVANGFFISPSVAGEIVWDDEATFRFVPQGERFQKSTSYEVTFKSDIKSAAGGTFTTDTKYSFTTVGNVKVVSFTPLNGSNNANPNNTNISLEFDQPVDQNSVSERLTIQPSIAFDKIWEGNKLTLLTAGKLAYQTRYTVTVGPGVKSLYVDDSNQSFSYSFTTATRQVNLAIPYYAQQESHTCNIASARMVLAYRGVNQSEAEIKNAIGTGVDPNVSWVNGYGMHVSVSASYIGKYRQVAIKQGWNLRELLEEVRNGNPVIIWEYNRYSQPYGAFTLAGGYTGYMGMHNEVVRGFTGDIDNPTSILTNDPWRGQISYTKNGFESVWSYLNFTALVVY